MQKKQKHRKQINSSSTEEDLSWYEYFDFDIWWHQTQTQIRESPIHGGCVQESYGLFSDKAVEL